MAARLASLETCVDSMKVNMATATATAVALKSENEELRHEVAQLKAEAAKQQVERDILKQREAAAAEVAAAVTRASIATQAARVERAGNQLHHQATLLEHAADAAGKAATAEVGFLAALHELQALLAAAETPGVVADLARERAEAALAKLQAGLEATRSAHAVWYATIGSVGWAHSAATDSPSMEKVTLALTAYMVAARGRISSFTAQEYERGAHVALMEGNDPKIIEKLSAAEKAFLRGDRERAPRTGGFGGSYGTPFKAHKPFAGASPQSAGKQAHFQERGGHGGNPKGHLTERHPNATKNA